MEQVRESSPQSTSRVAGVLFLICILTAGSGEMFFHGKMLIALGLVAVACCVAMTLLLYGIFKPVQKSLATLGMSLNLVGLLLEAVQFNPKGVDIALVFSRNILLSDRLSRVPLDLSAANPGHTHGDGWPGLVHLCVTVARHPPFPCQSGLRAPL